MPLAAHVHLGPQSTLRCPKTQRRPVGNLKVTSTVEPAHQPPHERNFQQSRDCFTRRGIMLAGFGLTSWNLGELNLTKCEGDVCASMMAIACDVICNANDESELGYVCNICITPLQYLHDLH